MYDQIKLYIPYKALWEWHLYRHQRFTHRKRWPVERCVGDSMCLAAIISNRSFSVVMYHIDINNICNHRSAFTLSTPGWIASFFVLMKIIIILCNCESSRKWTVNDSVFVHCWLCYKMNTSHVGFLYSTHRTALIHRSYSPPRELQEKKSDISK